MSIFPPSPNIGDQYSGYEWDGTAWKVIGIDLNTDYATAQELTDALADTTAVHGISDTSALVVTTDSRLSDARTPTAHASSHSSGGSDAVTLAISQVTGLQTALDGKVDDSQVLTNVPLGAVFTDTTTNETITLSGDVSGSGTSSIVVTVADDSHNHIISNVDGLQTALNAKAPLISPALTGTPTAPTAGVGTNTTQIATTAFVQSAISGLSVNQVVFQYRTEAYSQSLAAGAETGNLIEAQITPSSSSSKILVFCMTNIAGTEAGLYTTLYRDSTAIGIGDAASNRRRVSGSTRNTEPATAEQVSMMWLDSPGDTSLHTYGFRISHQATTTQTIYLNRSVVDTDNIHTARSATTLVLLEILA